MKVTHLFPDTFEKKPELYSFSNVHTFCSGVKCQLLDGTCESSDYVCDSEVKCILCIVKNQSIVIVNVLH